MRKIITSSIVLGFLATAAFGTPNATQSPNPQELATQHFKIFERGAALKAELLGVCEQIGKDKMQLAELQKSLPPKQHKAFKKEYRQAMKKNFENSNALFDTRICKTLLKKAEKKGGKKERGEGFVGPKDGFVGENKGGFYGPGGMSK